MTTSLAPLEVADRLFAAIQAGDVEGVRAVYAPGVQVWHNFDMIDQTAEENLRVLAWMVRKVEHLRYDDIRRVEIPGGFVQQHVLRGTAPNGQPIEVPAAMFCTVVDGRITRLEEYLDTAQTAPLRS